MKKLVLLIVVSFIANLGLFAQIPILYYDFEDNVTRTTFQNQADQRINTVASEIVTSSNLTVISDSSGFGIQNLGTIAGRCLKATGFQNQNADPGIFATHYIQFSINTSGFSGITLRMNLNTGPSNNDNPLLGVLVTYDGTNYVPALNGANYPNSNNLYTLTLGLPPGADHNPNCKIRVYGYKNPSPTSFISIDNLTIFASSTVPGKVFTSLNEEAIYTGTATGANGKVFLRGNFNCTGLGTYMSLDTSGVPMATGSTFTVSNQASLSFGDPAVPFTSAVFGPGNFASNAGTYLYMRSANGITSTAGQGGNLQVTGTRTIDGGGHFIYTHFAGTAQRTGISLPTNITGSLTINNTRGDTLTQSTSISSPGILYLTKGDFVNSTRLTMNTGTTINRDTGFMVSVPTFNMTAPGLTLIYSGAGDVISGFEVPSAKVVLQDYYLSKTAKTDTIRLGGDVQLNGTFYPTSGTLNMGTSLYHIRSLPTYTARVDAVNSANVEFDYTNTGRFAVERYIGFLRKWQLLSVPTDSLQTFKNAWQETALLKSENPFPGYGMQVTNQTGTSGTGFDTTSFAGHSVKFYNAATNTYTPVTNTTDIIKTTGGYYAFVRGDRTSLSFPATFTIATTLRTKGRLYTGTQTPVPVTANLFASIGNPYASSVNLLTIGMTNLIGVLGRGTVYVWDPSLTTGTAYGLGGYQTLTFNGTSTYNVVPGGGLYGSTKSRLESGQAFFVKAISNAAGSVTFAEADKNAGSAVVSLTGNTPPDLSRMLRANLYALPNNVPALVDGSLTYFDDQFADGIDNMDAEKMVNTSENFGIRSAGRTLVVDYRSLPGTGDTVFLNMANMRLQGYQLEIDAANLQANGRTAFLEDKYLNRVEGVDLNGKITYLFKIENIPGSYAANRFQIVFKQEIFPVAITDITAERNVDHSVSVKWNAENEINVAALEIQSSEDRINFTKAGIAAPQNNNAIAAYNFDDSKASLNALYYRIKSTETTGTIKYSNIAKVNAVTDISAGFSIYPNPVTGGKLNLRFTNQPAGTYVITVSDSKGQIIRTERSEINQVHALKNITLSPAVAPGSYMVTVTNANGKKNTVSFIIQ